LKDRGIKVEGDESDGFTETHQVLIRVREFGTGEDIARRLEENNIITNYQALPDDESFVGSSGIRMGVQEMTRFGMKEKDFEELAELIADCIRKNINVKGKVIEFRKRFLKMQYCLPPEKAVPLAVKVFSSIFPDSSYLNRFSETLLSFISQSKEF
jgi:glycine/serine hydroxymethyltransferase